MECSFDIQRLDHPTIQRALRTQAFGRSLFVLPEVSSTNSHALRLAEAHGAHGTVVVAERQTAGRGRLNRKWFSPPGFNLYASVILIPPPSFRHVSWIPLIAGLALTNTIQDLYDLQVTLKWPNDLLVDDKKLGGILCEGTSQGTHHQLLVIGIGLNVNMSGKDFPDELRPHSTSLRHHTQAAIDRNNLLAHLLNALESWYLQLLDGRIDSIRAAYTAQCGTLERELLVQLTNGEEFYARGLAIGEDGSLHVSLTHSPASQIRVIHTGDVTHLKIL